MCELKIIKWGGGIILKHSTPFILSLNPLFQLNIHNMLNTYIYHQLPPICFCVCYTVYRENIALLAQKLYAFFNVVVGGRGVMFRRKKDHLIMVMTKRYC